MIKEINAFDDNVPIPGFRRRSFDKYGFSGMNVGQSKFMPRSICRTQSSVLSNAKRFNPEDSKFSARQVTENGVLGNRVWRVA